jgi:hypothetical protein
LGDYPRADYQCNWLGGGFKAKEGADAVFGKALQLGQVHAAIFGRDGAVLYFTGYLLKARLKAVEGMEGDVDQVIDQMAMTDDLRVYLQNRCLKVITRARTPYRVPVDPTLPIIVRGKNGKMQIKRGGTPSAPKRTGTRADDQPVEARTAED